MENISKLLSDLADYIGRHQLPSGAIPWYDEGITDPWDHVECAIALDLTGRFERAVMAYRWMKNKQNPDGSWYSGYVDDRPKDLTRDTNHSTYIATGIWYHYLVNRDESFLREMWPSVQAAIDFALGLQQPGGEILWACNGGKGTWPGAIYAASTCVWQSVRSGLKIAKKLGVKRPDWEIASVRLLDAMRERRECFDRYGEDSVHRNVLRMFGSEGSGDIAGTIEHYPLSPEARADLLREALRVTGGGPVVIKDHITRGPGDGFRLWLLDFLGNAPRGAMVAADYLSARQWDELLGVISCTGEVLPASAYRTWLWERCLPNQLEICFRAGSV